MILASIFEHSYNIFSSFKLHIMVPEKLLTDLFLERFNLKRPNCTNLCFLPIGPFSEIHFLRKILIIYVMVVKLPTLN